MISVNIKIATNKGRYFDVPTFGLWQFALAETKLSLHRHTENIQYLTQVVNNLIKSTPSFLPSLTKYKRRDMKEPMGVSQWREYGKKYGYLEYFDNKLIDECIKSLPAEAEEHKLNKGEIADYEDGTCDGYNLYREEAKENLLVLKK